MSFGWSAGDLATAIKFVVVVGQALHDAHGAASSYRDTHTYLVSLSSVLESIRSYDDPEFMNQPDVESVRLALIGFRTKIERQFDGFLGETASSEWRKVLGAFKKVQYAVFTQKEVTALRNRIQAPLDSIKLRLGLATFEQTLEVRAALKEHQGLFERVASWLKPLPVIDTYNNVMSGVMPGSCEWLYQTDAYCDWRSASPEGDRYPTLWVSGIPGAGKTRLATSVIRQLIQETKIAYFYCSTQDSERRNVLGILRTWAWQILQQDASYLDSIASIMKRGAPPNITNMKEAVRLLIQSDPNPSLVLDGVDECELDSQKEIIGFLDQLARHCRIILFSREDSSISRCIQEAMSCEDLIRLRITEQDTANDIKRYLEREVRKLNLEDQTIEDTIVATLCEGAHGMFLWTSLMLGGLSTPKMFEDEYLDALNDLPTNLYALYEQQLAALFNNPHTSAKTRLMFKWLACAMRPLNLNELSSIMRISIDEKLMKRQHLVSLEKLKEVVRTYCGSLVHISNHGNGQATVELIHASLKDFLLDNPATFEHFETFCVNRDQTHILLAQTCLTYLCYENIESPDFVISSSPGSLDSSWDLMASRFDEYCYRYPFTEYATIMWSSHILAAKDNLEVLTMIKPQLKRFCESQSFTIRWLQHMLRLRGDRGKWGSADGLLDVLVFDQLSVFFPEIDVWMQPFRQPSHSRSDLPSLRRFLKCGQLLDFLPDLHVAAFFDYTDYISQRLGEGVPVDLRNFANITPLATAAAGDALNATKLLLQHHADPNARLSNDSAKLAPLNFAVDGAGWLRNEPVPFTAAELLLKAGADPFIHGWDILARLCRESYPGNQASLVVASLMLDAIPISELHRDKIEPSDITPLHAAARRGCAELVRLLIARGIPPDILPLSCGDHQLKPFKNTALLHALEGLTNTEPVVKELLDGGASVRAIRDDHRSVLHLVAKHDVGLARMLLEHGAALDHIALDGSTPLHDAVDERNTDLVALLCSNGANVEAEDSDGRTALDKACDDSQWPTVAVLIDAKAKLHTHMWSVIVHEDRSFTALRKERQHWPREPRDVFEVYFLIRRCFPQYRIVPHSLPVRIIEEAQYWLKSTARSEQRIDLDEEQCKTAPPYLTTMPVIGRKRHPVRQVIFHVKSHDQGFSRYPECHGTYENSWTWFEAKILQEANNEEGTYNFGYKDEEGVICTNLHAIWESKEHRVAFGYGKGQRSCEWMQALVSGDCIQVFPRARYPAWRNFVLGVGVDVYTTCVKELDV